MCLRHMRRWRGDKRHRQNAGLGRTNLPLFTKLRNFIEIALKTEPTEHVTIATVADCMSATGVWLTRLSPQWWSGRSAIAHIVLDQRSIICGYAETCTIGDGNSSQRILKGDRSVDIFVDLQPFGWNLKGGRFDPLFGNSERGGWGLAQSTAHP